MAKIWLILQREYLTRVRKKSFIVMTLLAPVLLAAFIAVPVWLASNDDDTVQVRLLDESGLVAPGLLAEPEPAPFRFDKITGPLATAKAQVKGQKNTVVLYAPANLDLNNPTGVQIFASANLGLGRQDRLERLIKRQLELQRLRRAGVDTRLIDAARAPGFDLTTVRLDKSGEQDDSSVLAWGLGYAGALLIYLFIFLYGVQVMRGVMEEKTNRIVEVIISSVKPFELMMGKVLGVAAVALTQFLLWVTLSWVVTAGMASAFGFTRALPGPLAGAAAPTEQVAADEQVTPDSAAAAAPPSGSKAEISKLWHQLGAQNWALLVGVFVFYFLGGYLLYAALFGAVGAAVDQETDSQQFMLPITMPLVLTFIVAQSVIIRNPDGAVATWMSLIPFTSPIAMVLRLPFGGVPGWQLALSMGLLIAGFLGTIWLAGRIYRVGILLYGKKPSWRELGKWLFYKG